MSRKLQFNSQCEAVCCVYADGQSANGCCGKKIKLIPGTKCSQHPLCEEHQGQKVTDLFYTVIMKCNSNTVLTICQKCNNYCTVLKQYEDNPTCQSCRKAEQAQVAPAQVQAESIQVKPATMKLPVNLPVGLKTSQPSKQASAVPKAVETPIVIEVPETIEAPKYPKPKKQIIEDDNPFEPTKEQEAEQKAEEEREKRRRAQRELDRKEAEERERILASQASNPEFIAAMRDKMFAEELKKRNVPDKLYPLNYKVSNQASVQFLGPFPVLGTATLTKEDMDALLEHGLQQVKQKYPENFLANYVTEKLKNQDCVIARCGGKYYFNTGVVELAEAVIPAADGSYQFTIPQGVATDDGGISFIFIEGQCALTCPQTHIDIIDDVIRTMLKLFIDEFEAIMQDLVQNKEYPITDVIFDPEERELLLKEIKENNEKRTQIEKK